MAYTYKMNKDVNTMMLENPEGTLRYEFFTKAIYRSNVDRTVEYYEPWTRYCQFLGVGSTSHEEHTSVEKGNELFKKLLAKGWKRVTFATESFA